MVKASVVLTASHYENTLNTVKLEAISDSGGYRLTIMTEIVFDDEVSAKRAQQMAIHQHLAKEDCTP